MDLRHRSAVPVGLAIALLVALATAGCGGSEPPRGDSPRDEVPVPQEPFEPPEEVEPLEPPDQPEYEPAPAEYAEMVCEDVLFSAPAAPTAEDYDDMMALVEDFNAELLDQALAQIEPAPGLGDLIAAMVEMRDLRQRAAVIYAEHPIYNEELTAIEQREQVLSEEVVPIASAAGAPMCAELVRGL